MGEGGGDFGNSLLTRGLVYCYVGAKWSVLKEFGTEIIRKKKGEGVLKKLTLVYKEG